MKTIRHDRTDMRQGSRKAKQARRKAFDKQARRELAYYLAEYSAATATGRA